MRGYLDNHSNDELPVATQTLQNTDSLNITRFALRSINNSIRDDEYDMCWSAVGNLGIARFTPGSLSARSRLAKPFTLASLMTLLGLWLKREWI